MLYVGVSIGNSVDVVIVSVLALTVLFSVIC